MISILLELPKTPENKCRLEYRKTESYYDTDISPFNSSRFDSWLTENKGKNKCLVNLGIFEYNLLRSWADEYFNPSKPHVIQTLYKGNSIIVNMGPASDFTWCGESKQKMNLIMKDSKDEPSYCKKVIDRGFRVLEGQVRINLAELTNCDNEENNYQDLDEQSFQCVDWEDIKMKISLNLNECHENLESTVESTEEFKNVYKRTCQSHKEKCYWTGGIGGHEKWGKLCSVKQNANSFLQIGPIQEIQELKSLKATKFSGNISIRDEEDTKMIFLNDSRGNLECLKRKYEIQSQGKK